MLKFKKGDIIWCTEMPVPTGDDYYHKKWQGYLEDDPEENEMFFSGKLIEL